VDLATLHEDGQIVFWKLDPLVSGTAPPPAAPPPAPSDAKKEKGKK
jgi:hypothetical protein